MVYNREGIRKTPILKLTVTQIMLKPQYKEKALQVALYSSMRFQSAGVQENNQ